MSVPVKGGKMRPYLKAEVQDFMRACKERPSTVPGTRQVPVTGKCAEHLQTLTSREVSSELPLSLSPTQENNVSAEGRSARGEGDTFLTSSLDLLIPSIPDT